MDQTKIGAFIADCRKKKGLTQMQLAEKLNITDRAVSKWETGRAMPDSSIMIELCQILKISVNDLLSGERVSVDNYNKELENNLLEIVKQKEESDKRLLKAEAFIIAFSILPILVAAVFTATLNIEEWVKLIIALGSVVPLLVALPFLIRIEQVAGYYQCAACGHKYVPSSKAVFNAMHMGRTRYMKCPKCGQKSWQKKRISKD